MDSRGVTCFREPTPFIIQLQGSVNGMPFRIEGKGTGDGRTGQTRGKFVCTSGKLPMAWAALAGTLGDGFKCYVNYPNGVTHFYQECMPEGYSQERVTRYPDDGTMKAYHEVTYTMGVITNRVTMQGEGFKKDSPVINKGLKCFLPNTETVYPYENGIRCLTHHVFPLRNLFGTGFIVATQTTVTRPLARKRLVKIPSFHFTRSEIAQSTEVDDEKDHVVQNEITEAFETRLLYECE